jgi:hypothetical protein
MYWLCLREAFVLVFFAVSGVEGLQTLILVSLVDMNASTLHSVKVENGVGFAVEECLLYPQID